MASHLFHDDRCLPLRFPRKEPHKATTDKHASLFFLLFFGGLSTTGIPLGESSWRHMALTLTLLREGGKKKKKEREKKKRRGRKTERMKGHGYEAIGSGQGSSKTEGKWYSKDCGL